MRKILIFTTALTLMLAPLNSATYASNPTARGRVPHSPTARGRVPRIHRFLQFPQNRQRLVRHSFRLVIPQQSKALYQLNISVPKNLRVGDNINVSDQAGQEINTDISIDGSRITLTFPKLIVPGTSLKIAMKNVKILGPSNAWLYRISVRLVGTDADLPIGIARFRTY